MIIRIKRWRKSRKKSDRRNNKKKRHSTKIMIASMRVQNILSTKPKGSLQNVVDLKKKEKFHVPHLIFSYSGTNFFSFHLLLIFLSRYDNLSGRGVVSLCLRYKLNIWKLIKKSIWICVRARHWTTLCT